MPVGGRISVDDIGALEQFRSHLIDFNGELAESFARMRGHWRDLGNIWHDGMYERFGTALEEASGGVDRYLTVTENHEAYLGELIARLHAVAELGHP
jgi:hypothetical protein